MTVIKRICCATGPYFRISFAVAVAKRITEAVKRTPGSLTGTVLTKKNNPNCNRARLALAWLQSDRQNTESGSDRVDVNQGPSALWTSSFEEPAGRAGKMARCPPGEPPSIYARALPGVLTAAHLLPPGPQGHLLLLAQLGVGLQVLAQQLRVVKQGAQVVDAAPASPRGKPLDATVGGGGSFGLALGAPPPPCTLTRGKGQGTPPRGRPRRGRWGPTTPRRPWCR